ncbi:MAG TPA: PfkB family carbohydrate kinase, partial [Microlunatus sp.]|nr:PfkB family carbohydrate kinase [Microlunatus sp.]
GQDEAEQLWGAATPTAVRKLLPNPTHLVIKDGPVGATELGPGGGSWHEPAPRVTVVEAIGAGDAFAGGYLAGLLDGASAPQRLRGGHDRAGIVLGATSDFPRDQSEVV